MVVVAGRMVMWMSASVIVLLSSVSLSKMVEIFTFKYRLFDCVLMYCALALVFSAIVVSKAHSIMEFVIPLSSALMAYQLLLCYVFDQYGLSIVWNTLVVLVVISPQPRSPQQQQTTITRSTKKLDKVSGGDEPSCRHSMSKDYSQQIIKWKGSSSWLSIIAVVFVGLADLYYLFAEDFITTIAHLLSLLLGYFILWFKTHHHHHHYALKSVSLPHPKVM
mgnify:CR=1 FL=1